MTNDGELSYRMTHPKFKVVKTYIATIQGCVSSEKLDQLRNGVMLEDGKTKPAKIKVIRQGKYRTTIEIKIFEGRNRQIRRMCKVIGHPVLELRRTSVDKLTLEGVATGEYRYLNQDEILQLRAKVQL